MTRQIIKTSDLQLADKIVRANNDPTEGAMVVKQIENDEVTLFRPYPTTADFSYTGGVICYVGIEEFKVPRTDSVAKWLLLDRKTLR